jgi:acyl transferase domain-containing protein
MSELEGIAIVGIAARFPGAHNAEELWRNLRDGIESVTFFTDEELATAGVDPALLADPRYVRAKGVLDGADRFDAAFFGFTPREAEAMDPQHRVFLECTWEALEDAACDPEHPAGHSGRIGVWAGSGASSYLISNLLPNQDRLESFGSLQVLLLNDRDFLATRASYELNLRGPSVSVQTACSTSLVAVHMACQSLLGGECDMALAGGVSISSPLRTGYLYQEGGVMSPDGRCRAFDAAASGAVEGNGCGIVALKRLADAVADGDRVYAVIRGSAVNNDGAAKAGFTAPGVEGQAEVISEALMMSGVDPETIGYVEAHGSGTPLGDPIEVAALTQAFRAADTAGARGSGFCGIGSVKASIGHCNTAAGVAGLIKTALALAHRTLPPSLHYETPNPQIDFAASPFRVVTEARAWPRPDTEGPRRAGVSSFGLGGTNAHAVLEEAPETEPGDRSTRPAQLFVLSARTPAALDAATARLAEHLDMHPDLELADVAWTLQTGRKAFEHRRIAVARDRSALHGPTVSGTGKGQGKGKAPVVFLFPGLGDQRMDMARELYEAEPFFREQVDLCAEKLAPWLGTDLREVLFSAGEWRPKVEKPKLLRAPAEPSRLDRTEFAQPACFVVEYALGRLLMEWGIEPQALIGYSLGEYVAACLSGALALDDALELVARRAKLIQELPEGAMLAVPLPEDEVRPLLGSIGEGIDLAATNGPHFCVVGGPGERIDALDRRLAERGVTCLRLRTTHAFHTGMMAPAMAGVKAMTRPMRAPRIPFVSNVTGTWITAADLADPEYWARHMRSPVRFAEGIGELLEEPGRVFLEVGPGATLGTLVKQYFAGTAGTAATVDRVTVPTLRDGADLDAVLEAVGRLWIAGVEVDWQRFHNGERRLRVPLPTYPFERRRYWIDPPKAGASAAPPVSDVADWLWVPTWKQVPRTGMPKPGRWLVFLDELGLGERIVERLRRDGREVVTVARRDGFDPAVHQGAAPENILHLWNVTRDEPTFEEAQNAGLASLTVLAQSISAEARLLVVANGLHELVDGDPVHPGKGTLLGALKVIHQEVPRLQAGSVDVVLGDLDHLAGRLLAELSGPPETAVALRGRQRWVRGFERVQEEGSPSRLVRGGVYLIAEAAHGPGMAIADHLVRDLDAKVALVLPPGQDAVGAMALEREAGPDRVLILHSLDLEAVHRRFGPIHGAFHTGGILGGAGGTGGTGGGLLQLKTPESLHAALDPVARSVEAFLAAVDPDAPAFILLSSTTPAVTGSLGQLEVAAAGSYLDAVAARRAAEGTPRTVTAHWDPYQWGGWLVTGVAGGLSGLAPEEVEAGLRAYGVPEAKSAAALERLLAAPYPRVIVSSRDLHALLAEIDSVTADTLLAQMTAHHGHHGEKVSRPGLSTPFEPPRDELEERLAAVWQDLFGIEPIGRGDSFLELGGHSLLAIQMVTQIRAALEVDLPVTALFESPTVAELATSIRRARGEADEADEAELEALLALVEGLSPEVAAMKLAEIGA